MQDDYSEVFKIPLKNFKGMTDWQKLGLDESKMAKMSKAKQREAVKNAHRELTNHNLFDPPKGRSEQELAEYLALIKKAAELLLEKLPPPERAEPIPEDKKKDLISGGKKASAPFSFSNPNAGAVTIFFPKQPSKPTNPKIRAKISFLSNTTYGTGVSCLINAFLDKPYNPVLDTNESILINSIGNYEYFIYDKRLADNNYCQPKHSDIRIVVYDSTRKDSFSWADKLLEDDVVKPVINSVRQPYSVILVSTKNDDERDRQVTSKSGAVMAEYYGIPFVETSAKNGTGIDELRNLIVKELDKRYRPEADAKGSAEPHNAGDGSSSKCAIL